MMKPYRIIEENDEFVIYEFSSIYLYLLYFVLTGMLVGFWTNTTWLSVAGICLMGLYFLTVSIPSRSLHQEIRKAMREGSVELSGSKWSFSKPLKAKLKKIPSTTNSPAVSEDQSLDGQ